MKSLADSISKSSTSTETTSSARKRNPYSIEELLKKPEKKIKFEKTSPERALAWDVAHQKKCIVDDKTVMHAKNTTEHRHSDSEQSNRDDEESDSEMTKSIEVCD
jgi:hypothetical protein